MVQKSEIILPNVPDLAQHLQRVEERLYHLSAQTRVPLVEEATNRFVAAGGKRLRSALMFSTVHSLGREIDDRAIRCAAAVELVHIGSLVHDDLMDAATERRGQRTINDEWGMSTALMVGDFCLATAGLEALSVSSPVGVELVQAVADMTDGQVFESFDAYNIERTEPDALRSLELKSGALFRAAGTIGALCAGASDEVCERVTQFSLQFGVSFQIIDDLLDLVSTTEVLGKPAGNDINQGTYTIPLLRALKRPELADVRELLQARQDDPMTEDVVAGVLKRVADCGVVEEIVDEVEAATFESFALLDDIGANGAQMREMAEGYLTWVRQLVDYGLN